MATYAELRALFSDDDLRNRITVATVVSANSALSGTPTSAQQQFANWVFTNPDEAGRRMLMAVLAAHKALTTAQINGAADSSQQTAVDAAVPNMTAALFGGA